MSATAPAVPTVTPTTAPVTPPEPTAAPVTAVRFEISTADGGAVPATARLCLEGQGVDVCQPLSSVVRTFAPARVSITIVRVTRTSITVQANDLPPGDYLMRLTGLAPYADITASLAFTGGTLIVQPVVLTLPGTPEPTPVSTATPAPTPPPLSTPQHGDGTTPASTTPPAEPTPQVTGLPSTGVQPAGPSSLPFALMLLTTGLVIVAGTLFQRRRDTS
jgi:hypothetical protein